MNLQEYLEEYKNITLNLMKEDLDSNEINLFIVSRGEILKILSESNFDKDEIRKIGDSLNLLKLEDELQSSMKKEMVSIKIELDKLKKMKQANMQYNSFENRARVFSKSI
ncbi:hypothetical protein [Clostridium beijerinckii]|uniref:Flagellar protein FliT n=1 Tax=Clostridium beijerinckii TaxID=1520 RepID=A0A9Q5GHK1_CLOBE|nr:hypothetical protein [Clostridium beijerinckii]AQS07144.1 hypothetical protein CLBIJ_45940 [Clostridium beijerinckii]MBA2883640.1 hypothetical protein [Clostridium beijerinckii]MBA2898827.1 hypothetical protein [Clostridium beijerinckii]MBA2908227.1 hypothetical protein [Clostridium beijerinckii]MBA9013224.1 hypothetical protein [Clostridium beijerinckii]